MNTIMEDVLLKSKGAIWYCSDNYASASLSKNSLGEFFYHVLKEGAQIGDIWVFNKNHNRSPVYVSVYMTEDMKNNIEKNTKFRFKLPPKLHLN